MSANRTPLLRQPHTLLRPPHTRVLSLLFSLYLLSVSLLLRRILMGRGGEMIHWIVRGGLSSDLEVVD
jgi:hypothetical protein